MAFRTDSTLTMPVRLAFPNLITPRAYQQGDKPKYSVTLLFPKNGGPTQAANGVQLPNAGATLNDIIQMLWTAVAGQWGNEPNNWPPALRVMHQSNTYISPTGKDGWPIRDGDMAEWEGSAGNLYVRAGGYNKVGIVDAGVNVIEDESRIYGGLIGVAQLNAFAYTTGTPGVSLGLSNIQILLDDGTRYSGVMDPTKVFEAFANAGAFAGMQPTQFNNAPAPAPQGQVGFPTPQPAPTGVPQQQFAPAPQPQQQFVQQPQQGQPMQSNTWMNGGVPAAPPQQQAPNPQQGQQPSFLQ